MLVAPINSIGCDLLENSYLCGSNNNDEIDNSSVSVVVICLKIPTFVVATTTWEVRVKPSLSCDLLENSYLCGSNNNMRGRHQNCRDVVICLKIPTFVVATTTEKTEREFGFSCDLLENSYLCGSNNNNQGI